MSGEMWRDARVRHAEDALASAVRTADEIIAEATRAIAERTDRPDPPLEDSEPAARPILRDAW